MAVHRSLSAVLKGQVLACGYGRGLVRDHYAFALGQSAEFAAFAHHPFDARSSCIAAIECKSDDAEAEVLQCRELGAPLIFACRGDRAQPWRAGRSGAVPVNGVLTVEQFPQFFAEHGTDLAPGRIYQAKTWGRLPGSESQLPLFVENDLLPFAEEELGRRLIRAVVAVVKPLEDTFAKPLDAKQEAWIYKATFRLLAAKILKDKGVPGFVGLDLANLDEAYRLVQAHYGSSRSLTIAGDRREILVEAAGSFEGMGSIQHLTTETLSEVYEEAFITTDARDVLGIHATPSYLVDYVTWRLAPWIKELPPARLRVFEPCCGHAPFLVGMIRLMRSLGLTPARRESSFFRDRLAGADQDPFALEIARLSLTLADVPNPNGWTGLRRFDVFKGRNLAREAAVSTVLLANPPFENGKALRFLMKTLPRLPGGAVFGVVVPTTLLFTAKRAARDFRAWALANCEFREVSLFPEGKIFRFADHEFSVLLGRRLAAEGVPFTSVQCRRVWEEDRAAFKSDYRFTSDRLIPQREFAATPQATPWTEELAEEVWSWLRENPRLESLALIGQGLTPISKKGAPRRLRTIEREPFSGSVPGYAVAKGTWKIHETPPVLHFNLDPEAIDRLRSGAPTGVAQVLIARNPVRGAWRLKPAIDYHGRPLASNFVAVRPRDPDHCPAEYLWALLASPLASAFFCTRPLRRNIHDAELYQVPAPRAEDWHVRRIARLVREYLAAASKGPRSLLEPEGIDFPELHTKLRRLDAEVLRLYELPARSERRLLDLFQGRERTGVPGRFIGYYPKGAAATVPLYAFLSRSFQRALAGGAAELPDGEQSRYDELVGRPGVSLTEEELNELWELQGEVDGRDYATGTPDNGWLKSLEDKHRRAQGALQDIAHQLLGLTSRTGASDENSPPR